MGKEMYLDHSDIEAFGEKLTDGVKNMEPVPLTDTEVEKNYTPGSKAALDIFLDDLSMDLEIAEPKQLRPEFAERLRKLVENNSLSEKK